MNTSLLVRDVSYSYNTLQGEIKVLNHINFAIKKGEFVALIGPSGCGKSTLFSLIAGLIRPTEGTIEVPGNLPGQVSLGYMLQHDHLLEWRNIFQNAMLGLEIQNKVNDENKQHVEELLRSYGLWEYREKRPSQLSGGMKQRVALIRTLALEPDLLLLDEPFSALDYQTRITVSTDICNLIRKTGKTVLLITHDLSEAVSLADRIIVLSKRPAHIIRDIPILLTRRDNSLMSARNAPEFPNYFNQLWEDLNQP